MAEKSLQQKVPPVQYRLLSPLKRAGKEIPAGRLITPTENELKAFGDRFELIPTAEQLEAERQRYLDDKQRALDEEKQLSA